MKHSLKAIYSLFILTFFSLFFESSNFWQTSKYLLLIIAAYFLYSKAIYTAKKSWSYHFIFLATTTIYVLFRSIGYDAKALTVLLTIAAIIGFLFCTNKKHHVKKVKKESATKTVKTVNNKKPQLKKDVTTPSKKKGNTNKSEKKSSTTVAKKANSKATKKKASKKKTTTKSSQKNTKKKTSSKKAKSNSSSKATKKATSKKKTTNKKK